MRTQSIRQLPWLQRNLQTVAIVAVFVILSIVFGALDDAFLTIDNLSSAGRQIAPTVVVAVAMTFVITAGGIDLSPGSLLAVCGASVGILAASMNPIIAVLVVLGIGALSGLFTGYISAYQGVAVFIVTLALLTGLRGVAELITGGFSVPIDSPFLLFFGSGQLLGVYVPVWISIIIGLLGWYLYSYTRYGRYVKAVGSNEESARRAGIDTRRIRLLTLLGTGVAAAVAGILIATRLGSSSSNIGVAFELEAITAVVLGGTSLMGGRGSVVGSVFGALTLGVLSNGLVLIGMDVYWVPILQGAILLLAILANYKVFLRISGKT